MNTSAIEEERLKANLQRRRQYINESHITNNKIRESDEFVFFLYVKFTSLPEIAANFNLYP